MTADINKCIHCMPILVLISSIIIAVVILSNIDFIHTVIQLGYSGLQLTQNTLVNREVILVLIHCKKKQITFLPKEMCTKYYTTEQISGSLHEIRLCHVHLMYISRYRKFNFFCSELGELKHRPQQGLWV